jgi:hypothetical protein
MSIPLQWGLCLGMLVVVAFAGMAFVTWFRHGDLLKRPDVTWHMRLFYFCGIGVVVLIPATVALASALFILWVLMAIARGDCL